jgi:hypothetical protein
VTGLHQIFCEVVKGPFGAARPEVVENGYPHSFTTLHGKLQREANGNIPLDKSLLS